MAACGAKEEVSWCRCFLRALFFSHITTDRSRSDCEDMQIRQNVRPGGGDVDKTRQNEISHDDSPVVPTHEHAAEDSAT